MRLDRQPEGLESANQRILVDPGERIEVRLRPAAGNGTIVVRADDGGVINGRSLRPQVELSAEAPSFTFAPGGHRGLYTVTISRGKELQVLEFWVGNEAPTGRPGPQRVITLPTNLVTEGSEPR